MAIKLVRTCGEVSTLVITTSNTDYNILIDTHNLMRVLKFPYAWCVHHQGTGKRYAMANTPRVSWEDQYSLMMHRFILNVSDVLFVDHWNGNTLDNREHNLRRLNNQQNQMNRQGPNRTSKSGIRGVSWYKARRQWRAQARLHGKSIHIGYYSDKEEAAQARRDFEAAYWAKQGMSHVTMSSSDA